MIDKVADRLLELDFIGSRQDIVTVKPIYLAHNYCLPGPETTERLRGYLAGHDVHSIGRYGSWHWSSQHEDMQQAIDLARQLQPKSLSPASVN